MTRLDRARCALSRALAAAGCGEKEEPGAARPSGRAEPLRLVLDYFPNADHAGIYAAQAAGEYEQAGLDVKIQAPPDPSAPLRLLQAGRADLAISYEPELLLARDKGADDLVSVGALVQKPLTSLMSIAGSGDPRRAGPRGQARRHRRDLVPDRLPADDPREGRRRPRRRSRRPTSASTSRAR